MTESSLANCNICHKIIPLLFYYCSQGQVFIQCRLYLFATFFCHIIIMAMVTKCPITSVQSAVPVQAINRNNAIPASQSIYQTRTSILHVRIIARGVFSELVTYHLHLFFTRPLMRIQPTSTVWDSGIPTRFRESTPARSGIFAESGSDCSCVTVGRARLAQL